MKLLHLVTSIQGDASVSRALSAAIVARLLASGHKLEIGYRDLAKEPLSHLTLDAFGSAEAGAIADEFLGADVVVLGVAMYNFTIPSQLKAWIDRILVAGKTFRYTAHGAEGLAGGKRVIVASPAAASTATAVRRVPLNTPRRICAESSPSSGFRTRNSWSPRGWRWATRPAGPASMPPWGALRPSARPEWRPDGSRILASATIGTSRSSIA